MCILCCNSKGPVKHALLSLYRGTKSVWSLSPNSSPVWTVSVSNIVPKHRCLEGLLVPQVILTTQHVKWVHNHCVLSTQHKSRPLWESQKMYFQGSFFLLKIPSWHLSQHVLVCLCLVAGRIFILSFLSLMGCQILPQQMPWWKYQSGLETQHVDSNADRNENKDPIWQSP